MILIGDRGVHNNLSNCNTNKSKVLHLPSTTKRQFSVSIMINPFVPNAPLLYPLKTSENLSMFSGSRERVHWEEIGKIRLLVLYMVSKSN